MKVKLIIPPSKFLIDEKVFPFLGILKVGESLKRNNIGVSCIDLSGIDKWQDVIKKSLDNVDVVGITSTTPQIPEVVKIGIYIKKNFPKIKIIIGGSHVTMVYSSIKNGSNRCIESFEYLKSLFDKIVIGYGELAIIEAIDENNKEQIIDAESSKKIKFSNEVYNQIPFPARELIDLESYHYHIEGKKSTSLICQLGCPYNCNFCGGRQTDTYRKIRTRSVETIIEEIDMLVKNYNYRGFMFYDDEININDKIFKELLKKLIKYQQDNKVELSFRGFTRADLLTEEQAILMKLCGFKWLLVGFESGSNKILKNMNKKTTVEQNTKVFKMAKRNNMKVKALMSIGHPGESLETIKETSRWLLEVKPDEIDVTIVTLYPGSPYFDESVFDGEKWVYTTTGGDKLYSLDNDFLNGKYYYKSKQGEFSSYVFTENLRQEEIIINRELLANGKIK